MGISGKTLAVAAIAAALGFGGAMSYQAAAAPPAKQNLDSFEHMRHALEALHNAKEALEHADREYHGHRDHALGATRDAIAHVEAALHD